MSFREGLWGATLENEILEMIEMIHPVWPVCASPIGNKFPKVWGNKKHQKTTLPETNSSHLKIGLPNRKVVFQPSIFRGENVSFRECVFDKSLTSPPTRWFNHWRLSCDPETGLVNVTSIWATKKTFLLSIESWLFNRDPYNSLL